MKKVLIHSRNTSFSYGLFDEKEQLIFEPNIDLDFDEHCSNWLNNVIVSERIFNADIVFIKAALGVNYADLLGVRLTYHLRYQRKNAVLIFNKPIVLIAEEKYSELAMLLSEPCILITEGIYLIEESYRHFEGIRDRYKSGTLWGLINEEKFKEIIRIDPPANYNSHHSISNEWALYRLFSIFANSEDNSDYLNLKRKVENLSYLKSLHFKISEAKDIRQKFGKKNQRELPRNTSAINQHVCIVDDELDKGWEALYRYLFNNRFSKLTFLIVPKISKRDQFVEKLFEEFKSEIASKEHIPIFIIDLRLHPEDYLSSESNQISGLQLIQKIKKFNPGIQIIVSSSSNKIWNFKLCLELGVDHYFVKESPENLNTRNQTWESLLNFFKDLSFLEKRSFLAKFYWDLETIKKEHKSFTGDDGDEFVETVFGKNGMLANIFSLLSSDPGDHLILNQVILICFHILENYCDLGMVGNFGMFDKNKDSSGFIWNNDSRKEDIYIKKGDSFLSKIKFIFSSFSFQKSDSKKAISSCELNSELQITKLPASRDAIANYKMVSVLAIRDKIDKPSIERLLALRYYRSKRAAHDTGDVIPEYSITKDDIVFFIGLFKALFVR